MNLRKLYYSIPPGLRMLLRRLIYLPSDAWQQVTNRDAMIPSKGDIYTGSGNFIQSGQKFTELLTEYCDLSSESKILDIGSGIGRLAIPLTEVIKEKGSYQGFDVVEKGIKWCQKHISQSHPHFSFMHVDLANSLYKNAGLNATDFDFPYMEEQFDLSASISVYTHLLPNELKNYLKETRRVGRRSSKHLASFFLYESKSELTHNPEFQFKFPNEECFLMDEKVPHANVAYEKSYLFDLIEKKYGYKILHYLPGNWHNREEETVDFQDILIYQKP